MFSRGDLDELVATDAQPAVSLYLPTHMAGPETRQDPIRLKNLLSVAVAMAGSPRRNPSVTTRTRSARKNRSNFCTASSLQSSLSSSTARRW
jgi:hypothetical protein